MPDQQRRFFNAYITDELDAQLSTFIFSDDPQERLTAAYDMAHGDTVMSGYCGGLALSEVATSCLIITDESERATIAADASSRLLQTSRDAKGAGMIDAYVNTMSELSQLPIKRALVTPGTSIEPEHLQYALAVGKKMTTLCADAAYIREKGNRRRNDIIGAGAEAAVFSVLMRGHLQDGMIGIPIRSHLSFDMDPNRTPCGALKRNWDISIVGEADSAPDNPNSKIQVKQGRNKTNYDNEIFVLCLVDYFMPENGVALSGVARLFRLDDLGDQPGTTALDEVSAAMIGDILVHSK